MTDQPAPPESAAAPNMRGDLKPQFRPWMRRLDPMLAQEDSNAIYNAFRAWREEHTRGLWGRMSRTFRTNPLFILYAIGAVMGFVLVVALVAFVGCLGFILLAVVGVAVSALLSKMRKTGALPRTVAGLFSGGIHSEAVHDLWLTGITGRELMMAMYLERRRQSFAVSLILSLLLTAMVVIPYIGVNLSESRGPHPMQFLCFGMVAWFLVEVFLSSWTGGMTQAASKMRATLDLWRSSTAVGHVAREIGRQLFDLMKVGLVLFVIYIVLFGCVLLVTFLAEHVAMVKQFLGLPVIKDWVFEWIFSLFLLVLALPLHLRRRPTLRKNLAAIEEHLRHADFAFDYRVAGELVNDPDGRDWACWRHGERAL